MTGPEPGDRWEEVAQTAEHLARACRDDHVDATVLGSLLGSLLLRFQAPCPLDSPLSVVPTDSLEARVAETLQAHRLHIGTLRPTTCSCGRWKPQDVETHDEHVAAAVRSAITKPTTED